MILNDQSIISSLCNGTCNQCASQTINRYMLGNLTYGQMAEEYKNLGEDFGSTLGDRSAVRLSCHKVEQMWFDVMRSYAGIGGFLSIFSLFAIILYFVTSSDSGSLVIDCLSSNGDPDPPRIQRVFWALMEGATATALLVRPYIQMQSNVTFLKRKVCVLGCRRQTRIECSTDSRDHQWPTIHCHHMSVVCFNLALRQSGLRRSR